VSDHIPVPPLLLPKSLKKKKKKKKIKKTSPSLRAPGPVGPGLRGGPGFLGFPARVRAGGRASGLVGARPGWWARAGRVGPGWARLLVFCRFYRRFAACWHFAPAAYIEGPLCAPVGGQHAKASQEDSPAPKGEMGRVRKNFVFHSTSILTDSMPSVKLMVNESFPAKKRGKLWVTRCDCLASLRGLGVGPGGIFIFKKFLGHAV